MHNPVEFPRVSKRFLRVKFEEKVHISVKPNLMTTSESLIKYAPDRRQCYFENERNLQFFKVYTKSNCEFECFVNLTLVSCGCVKFSMPRTNKTKLCGQTDLKCCEDVEKNLMLHEFETRLDSEDRNQRGVSCSCLPSCTSIDYEAELLVSQVSQEKREYVGRHTITISFKDADFISSKRSEMYNWFDFMANCGGLLSKLSLYSKI